MSLIVNVVTIIIKFKGLNVLFLKSDAKLRLIFEINKQIYMLYNIKQNFFSSL